MKIADINKRISHKDEFELCYLRHQYLKRVTHNPTREEMFNYNKIVENFSRNTFYVYKNLFLMVGLDLEDVINISQVHLVSFLGLFAMERNPDKLKDFEKLFQKNNIRKCESNDILDKNKANFTCFLKQRLEDVVRVCKQKAKNVKGVLAEDFIVFTGKKKPPMDIEDLIDNHGEYDYHPLGTQAFKTIKKRMKNKQEGPVYLENGVWYVCVSIRKKNLTLNDFTCNDYNPYDNIHNMSPEQVLEKTQETNWDDKWQEFSSIPPKNRARILNTFIKNNKNNKEFKEELRIANKFLESINANAI